MATCKCPEPPGGTVICTEDQMAICHVSGGNAEMSCITIPPSLINSSGTEADIRLVNALINVVKGDDLNWNLDRVMEENSVELLMSNNYYNSETSETTSFELPESIKSRLLNRKGQTFTLEA